MKFDDLNDYLEWVTKQSIVIFSYEVKNKNFLASCINSLHFYDPKDKKVLTLDCPTYKQDNRNFLRTIRKTLFEMHTHTVITYDLKGFLNFIPGQCENHCDKIYDIYLLQSIINQYENNHQIDCANFLHRLKNLSQTLTKTQHQLYDDILLSCVWIYSDIEKNGLANKYGTKSYSYYDLAGTVSGRLSNNSFQDKRFFNPLNIACTKRDLIVAPSGYQLIMADYNAMEMRVLAYLSQDPVLQYIFHNHKDVYTIIGQSIFDTKVVTQEQRIIIKNICLRIIYGSTEYGIMQGSNLDFQESKELIKKFYSMFQKVEEWYLTTQIDILNDEYVESIFGRQRQFEFNDETNKDKVARQGQNFKVQSPAYDIVLACLIELNDKLLEESKILISLHDCLVFLSPENKIKGNIEIIKNVMINPEKIKSFNIEDIYLDPVIEIGKYWR